MKNVKVGDDVYCFLFEHGKVVNIAYADAYPIIVKDDYGNLNRYTFNGELDHPTQNTNRTLYYSKPKFEIPPEPIRHLTINGCQVFGSIQVSKDNYSGNVLMIDIADINGVIKLHSDSFSESQWNHCVRMGILFPDTSDGWRDAAICLNAYTGGRHVPF